MNSKVACVEDFDSVVQETVPSSRREAFRKRASGLTTVTNSSDTGTVDSGYSSNSTANHHGEIFPESPIHSSSPGGEEDDHGDIDSAPLRRPSPPPAAATPSSKQDGRQSRSSNPHRMSGGSYSHGHPLRPHSRAASKSLRDGRASPAVKCPPINTSSGPADDNCDCPDCSAATSARPSPRLPNPPSALETPWNLDMPSISNGLPYVNTSQPWASAPLSSSPGSSRGLGNSKNGFPFETFPTPSSANASGALNGSRPSSYISSGSNPLASWTNNYNDYVSSPASFNPPSSALNSLHSPPPYLGSSSNSSWIPPLSGVPGTPSSARGPSFIDDYAPLPYHSSGEYNLYGSGSGAGSARDSGSGGYTLPPRSASVQPVSNLGRRQRSSSYHHQGDMDFSTMPLPGPGRRPIPRQSGSKSRHAPTASYDSRYDAMPLYDPSFDPSTDPAYEEYIPPTPPINRRLSRTSTLSGGLLPGDIARATSVPAENYVTDIQRARRNTNVTPQPLAITARERGRRGSNSSGGLSSSQRRAHEAMLDNLVEQVIVEPRPGLELAKRDSGQQLVPLNGRGDYDYDDGGYNDYVHYGGNHDNNHHEDALIHHDRDGEPFTGRYPTNAPGKYNYHGGEAQRSLRLSSDRRHSISRAYTLGGDYYQPSYHLQSAGNELEHIRRTTKSRGAGSERRFETEGLI